ncbi:hypothetical protein AciM339_0672 [Aciduliprofundum sp. MAR08-339]|uniref:hypothetical protein n=1 Tax=Aciduliprofundum sp. (strain MAR08-339) TaxID=673860 RepID=UPI0002A49517|nr:hypothetical protein AciM339_0672 [Aciduliprofundum sp. MAR08-339]
MDLELNDVDENTRFEVKLQISLYNTALKVFREDRKEDFERYMLERVEKIKRILGIEVQSFRVLENGNVIFEVRE